VLKVVGLPPLTESVVSILRWPVLLGCVVLVLAVIYRFGPSRNEARWRWVTWGSALAAFLWLVASILFSWYAANFGSYNKTYGSLGAAIGFMTWIWLSSTVVLAGAELDAEMERQTARDTTAGPERPLGARVADTVA
jgi:membrane protein